MTIYEKQHRILMEILKNNRKTDYGYRYGFDKINTVEQFRDTLPLACYDDYAPLIELMRRLGERNIFTNDTITCYMLSFGNDGTARFIPCTDRYIELYTAASDIESLGKLLAPGHVFLLNASFPKLRRFNDGLYLNSISGTLLAKYTEHIFGKKRRDSIFTSPKELIYPEGMFDLRYARMLFALADEDLRIIAAPYAELITDAFSFLEDNWEMLADDIESGLIRRPDSLPEEFWVPGDIREKLEKMLKPNPERARKLRLIFKDGFEQPLAHRVWPQLAFIVTKIDGVAKEDMDRLKFYTGNIPISNTPYFSPEALVGSSVAGSVNEYALLPSAGFFEFLPEPGAKDQKETLLIDDLSIGGEYGVVVTNCLGLYRYIIGDTIRVLRKENDVPIIQIVRRAGGGGIKFSNIIEKENLFRTVERELTITTARC